MNFVPISHTSRDLCVSRFSRSCGAAIFDFPLPVWSHNIPSITVGLLDPKNIGVAVEIMFLTGVEAEIHGGIVYPMLATYVCKRRLATLWGKVFPGGSISEIITII